MLSFQLFTVEENMLLFLSFLSPSAGHNGKRQYTLPKKIGQYGGGQLCADAETRSNKSQRPTSRNTTRERGKEWKQQLGPNPRQQQ